MVDENEFTYDELAEKVQKLTGAIEELRRENKDLLWFKMEYEKVKKLEGKIYQLRKALIALAEGY